MKCYIIVYTDRHGTHSATKWADDPKEALRLLKRAHKKRKWRIVYDEPKLVEPQPFSDGSRAKYRQEPEIQPPNVEVEIHEADDEPPPDNFDRGDNDDSDVTEA